MSSDLNILKIENISKYFGGLAAVSDCSLTIKRGTITGIIGPNGSGKTTLFNLIAGNDKLKQQLTSFSSENEIRKSWEPDLELFKKIRNKYLIYD